MTLSDLSVRRPVFAAVAAIILVVVGIASFLSITVRELPSVDPPQVSVVTSYLGASAEIVEQRITEPLEVQVGGIPGIERIQSSSRDGRSFINVFFKPGRDLDEAANDVRDAVSRAVGRLPIGVDPPQVSKANSDSAPVIIGTLMSKTMNRLEMTDFATRYIQPRLSTIDGVAEVRVGGAANYAMRIWLDPDAMAARNITVDDVETAMNNQNVELPAGQLESTDKDLTVRVQRAYSTPEQFAELPITTFNGVSGAGALTQSINPTVGQRNGYITRLGDIARIEEGADEDRRLFRSHEGDSIGLPVVRQSDGNELEITAAVRKALVEIQSTLPAGTKIAVASDFSIFTREAIKEVWLTMGISLFLVAIVNIMFLGSWRSAIIPTIVAPICIISTFIVLAVFGFSVNLLTLLALVLAIGLVVDDAIVVVENIQRRIDEGEPPLVAAERGAKQVFFAIVAVTAVLLTVFAPMMFMPGYTGKLFVELAVAVAAAIFFSALLALSLSPMLASKLLRPAAHGGGLARFVDKAVNSVRRSYVHTLNAFLGTRTAAIAVCAVVVVMAAGAAGLFVILPKELVPNEDRGRVDINVASPEGAGFEYSKRMVEAVQPLLQKLLDEKIAERYTLNSPGFGGSTSFSGANGNLTLVPWGKRDVSAQDVATGLNREFAKITGARVNASVRGALAGNVGPRDQGGNSVQFIAKGADYPTILAWLDPIFQASRANPGFSRVRYDYEPISPRVMITIDRDKAAALGVSPRAIGRTLETMLGSRRSTTYVREGKEYDVLLQLPRAERRTEDVLNGLYVRSSQGGLVPLSNLVKTEARGDAPDRRRVDRQLAVSLQFDLEPGTTMDQAITLLKTEAAKNPASGVTYDWGGGAKDFLDGSSGMSGAFALALLLVFLVLAAQFESWIHPAVIMVTVPLATLGGLFALFMAGSSINLYSQIGLIILIGIAAKNGILIVEFANQLRDQGRTIKEAIIESSSVRLRPIVMTSIAAAFGALPLIFAHGPGKESRFTIGLVIFSGALFTTLLTLFVVPVLYNMVARFTRSPEWTGKLIDGYVEEPGEPIKLAAE